MSQIHVVPNNNQKIQSEKSEADNENTLEEFKDQLKEFEVINRQRFKMLMKENIHTDIR